MVQSVDDLLAAGVQRHRAGDLHEARRHYQNALDESPTNPLACFRLGLLELQEHHPEVALPLIEQAVAAAPREPTYHFALGEVFSALGRWEQAVDSYHQVPEGDPHFADANCALGLALQSSGDYRGAICSYQTAIKTRPDFAEAFNNLGNCHRLSGELAEAEIAYRAALLIRPTYADAASNVGVTLNSLKKSEQAFKMLQLAVRLEPASVSCKVNLGAVLCDHRRFIEAEAVLREALKLDEANADACYNLGLALHELRQRPSAVGQYKRAVELRPDHADAWNNLGNLYRELGDLKLAGSAYDSAIRARPGFISAINNSCVVLRSIGQLDEAEASLRRVLQTGLSHPVLYDTLGNVLKDAGELDEAIQCFQTALRLDPSNAATHSNLAYALSFQSPAFEPILKECLRWNSQHAKPLQSNAHRNHTARTVDSRIRIGYVSPDFRNHCQALFMFPLLSNHDHERFEIFCYSCVERPDDHTRRLAGIADCFRDVSHLDDSSLANLIRSDQIDILVDLTMHMANGRPLVFARKPAPVQIAWLAYPGTTGIDAIAYRLSDPRLDPPGFDGHYSEQTVRLADSFWCYHPLTSTPEINELPALTAGHLTLGCLNNPCKLTDHTLRLWGGVMRILSEAKLLLLAPPGSHRLGLQRRLSSHGIAADRVRFVPYQPREMYLRNYHDIDLGLDTFPYNGHTTSLDSLWMGVPVITRVGQTCVGRGGLSQLFQLDLTDLAADDDEAFISIAVLLAADLPRLSALRRQLRSRLEASPLMNGPRFARQIESAYRQILDLHAAASATPDAVK